MEQEQARGLGRPGVAALLALLPLIFGACGRSESTPEPSPAGDPAPDVAALEAELAAARSRIRDLEGELASASAERIEREQEWLRYTKAITELSSAAQKPLATFEPMPDPAAALAEEPAETPEAPDPEAVQRAAARDREVLVALRSLLAVEQVLGYDLLETGTLGDGWTGPVVLRALDGRGRPVGTVAAERLRLEGSRAARTVTIVLENGYERRAGQTIPFAGPPSSDGGADGRGAQMRIELPGIDPASWIESVPELFREVDRAPAEDDGRWDLGAVRAALNLLLREDVEGGWWRLVALGGVKDGVLRDVQLDRLDAEGRLERKLFADRMEVAAVETGVRIELSEGVQLRGDVKTPFLEGRYRIFLPRADVARWRERGVPGVAEAGD